MRNWKDWNDGAADRSRRASHAANARWDKHRAADGEPIRKTRVEEIMIRSSLRPMQIIRIERQQSEHGWSRGRVTVNSQRVGRRTLGRTALSKLIWEALR